MAIWTDETADNAATYATIQEAIDAAIANSGGIIYIGPGTYTLSAGLSIVGSNITIYGSGDSTIITLANGVDDSVITYGDGVTAGLSGFKLYNVKIDGNASNQAGTSHGVRLRCDNGTGQEAVLYGVTITDTLNSGVSVDTCTYTRITDCTISSAGNHGIYLESVSRCNLTGNTIYDCTQSGVQIYGSSDNGITNNTIFNCNHGLDFQNTAQINTATGNVIRNSQTYGIYINGGDSNTIVGNDIKLSNQGGIKIRQATHNVVNGNTLYRNTEAANDTYDEILLEQVGVTYCTYNKIVGNNILASGANKARYGIYDSGNANNDFNVFIGNTSVAAVTAQYSIYSGLNNEYGHNIGT